MLGEFYFLLLIVSVFFVGGLVQSSVGFGFALIVTPIIALFLSVEEAISYTLIPIIVLNLLILHKSGGVINAFKKYYFLALSGLVGNGLGTQILFYIKDDTYLKFFLASTIVFYLIFASLKFKIYSFDKNSKLAMITFGLIAGIVGGLTNAMGTIIIIYTIEANLSKNETIQSSNIAFLLGKLIQIIFFANAGKLDTQNLYISLVGVIAVVIAVFIGSKIKNKINEKLYKNIIKIFLLIVTLVLLKQVFI